MYINKKHIHADFKLISFYDNEWGYTSQIFRLISHMYQVDHGVK